MIHKKVNDMYCKEFKNVTQCCSELNISPSTYYKICKELERPSVGSPLKTAEKQTGGSVKKMYLRV